MDTKNFCQSCSMPLDNAGMHGTEKDGSPSNEYCQYCYQNGGFTSPEMTMGEMTTIVKSEMAKQHMSVDLIEKAVNVLPNLKRWKV
jgi:Putative zinc ribbon domain